MSQRAETITIETPITLPGGAVLRNRLAKAALSEQLGSLTHAPTPALRHLHRRWSEGGFGLIITGNVMVDRGALGEPRNVAIEDRRDFAAIQGWAEATKSAGAAAWMQINHPGRQSPRILSLRPVAPSPVAMKGLAGQFGRPRALTDSEIHRIIERFANTAAIAVEAGFDGIQVHSAHGYLSSQFLSPLTNQRTDAWGGTPEKRMRFLLEVVRAVRQRIGGASLGVKLNSADFQRGGFTQEESMQVAEALSAEAIDLLEISGGTYEGAAMMGTGDEVRESTRRREAYFLEYAEAVRAHTTTPLMLTGGLRSRAAMDEALASGAIDVIGLGRPACIDAGVAGGLLDRSIPAITSHPPVRTGMRGLDDAMELSRHTTSLWALGAGRSPARAPRAATALTRYAAATAAGASAVRLRRALRR